MYECTACHNQFSQPKKVGLSFGLGWLIFVVFSMGIGLIFFIISSINRKKVCPYCGNTTFLDAKYAIRQQNNNNLNNNQIDANQQYNNFSAVQADYEEKVLKEEIKRNKGIKAIKILLVILIVIIILGNISSYFL